MTSMKFKNMSIHKKLLISVILIAFISNISGVVGLLFLQKTNEDYKYALINYGFAQGNIGQLGIEVEGSYSTARELIISKDKQEIAKLEKEITNSFSIINEKLPTIESQCDSEEENVAFLKAKEGIEAYETILKTAINLSIGGNNNEALRILKVDGGADIQKMREGIDELLQINIDRGNELSNSLNNLKIITLCIMFTFIIVVICIVTILIRYLTKAISEPIKEISKVSEEIAKGNLNLEIEVKSNDEIGKLSASLKNILDYLNSIFYKIKDSSYQVAAGSEEVAASAQALAEGATEQASSITQLSASMQEINEQVQTTAHNAENVNRISDELLNNIEDSNKQMKEMLLAMDDIEEASKNIAKIINVIEGIADQTNLLALNATIEAARAGEAGKGFGVVALEVRDLASQSATASKQTTDLIENAMKTVERGRKLADKTANNLVEVVKNANKTSNLVFDIVGACEEQAGSIEEVNQGIIKITDIVHCNSANSEESAAASEELTMQVDALNKMIEHFKLRDGK